jgi:hypothetical protein
MLPPGGFDFGLDGEGGIEGAKTSSKRPPRGLSIVLFVDLMLFFDQLLLAQDLISL